MTIKDLAAKTGYAVGTVSRALNNHPNVSERARQEILEAAAESGFQLNVNAKQLKQHHSTTILVVVKGIGNELFGEMVESIQTLIAQTHYQLVVDYMDEDENEVRRAAQLCREKKPLGILFLGGNNENFIRDFGGIDVPCVVVTNDASMLSFDNLSSVSTDDREAACSAMDTLIRLGHSRIAITGPFPTPAVCATRAVCSPSLPTASPSTPSGTIRACAIPIRRGIRRPRRCWIRAAGSPRFSPPPT